MRFLFSKIFYCLCYCSCPNFPPLSPSTQPVPHSHSPQSVVSVHGSCIYVLWLILSPIFNQSLPLLFPLTAVILFHVSMSLALFFSLVYFVHWIPVINDVIWYLSFTNCLISLSIIFSSSIHAVTSGMNSFFYSAA